MTGKLRRLHRIRDGGKHPTIITPLDDSLLAGPEHGLRDLGCKVAEVVEGQPDAVIAFPGLLQRYERELKGIPTIVNLTASTTVGCHTRKILTSDVEEAVALGADGVAVHVNITSLYEHEMLALLGRVNKECSRFGMPLFAIMYPRREADGRDDNYEELRRSQPEAYAKLVRHAVRVGVELGADLIKTQYTGSLDTFTTVIASACGVPVFIAGGPLVDSSIALRQAVDAVAAGAAGVSFGRNVFNRSSSTAMLKTLRMVIDGAPLESAMASNSLED